MDPTVELSAKIHQNCVKVKGILFSLDEMAKRLRAERKARGLNQGDFGALGGVTLQTQSRYEKAETEPGAAYFAMLGAAGIDIKYVLMGVRASESLKPEVAEAASILSKMDAEALASFVQLLQTIAERSPFPPNQYRHYK